MVKLWIVACGMPAPGVGTRPKIARGSPTNIGAVTPDELSSAIRDAVARAVDSGAFAAESRPRSSSSVRRTGPTATTPPISRCGWPRRPASRRAQVAEAIAKALLEADGIAAVDVAGPGFLNITIDAGSLGELARTHRRGRRRPTATASTLAGTQDQPGVRLGQPDRPGAHRRRPVGRGRRLAGPDPDRGRRRGHPGVLLQRPRRADRPVRPLAAGRRPRRADPRGRLRRRLHR